MTGSATATDRTARQVHDLRVRLREEFRPVVPEVVDRLVDEAWALAGESRVQQYRSILAERYARRALAQQLSLQDLAPGPTTPAGAGRRPNVGSTSPSRSVA